MAQDRQFLVSRYFSREQKTRGMAGSLWHAPVFWVAFCNRYRLFLYDRFEKVPSYVNYGRYGLHEVPNQVIQTPYADLCMMRAEYLVRSGRYIRLFWSGGIDSTVAMVALIKAGVRKDQIEVALTYDSVLENNRFYEDHILGKFKIVDANQTIAESALDGDTLTIDGEHNDQLFGSDVMYMVQLHLGMRHLLGPNTPETFAQAMRAGLDVDEGLSAEFRDVIMHHAEACGVQLRTIFDICWWINFSFKWREVNLRSAVKSNPAIWPELTKERWERNVLHFFDNLDFQRWSVTSREPKILGTWNSYKHPAKRFIFDHTKDEDAFHYQVKIGSLQNIMRDNVPQSSVALTTDWKFVTNDGVYPSPKD